MKKLIIFLLFSLFSVVVAQGMERYLRSSICDIQNSILTIPLIIGIALFVLAGIVFWPAVGLTILGWYLKKDKTEKQDPGAYKLYRWGILGLKILAGLIVLAILAIILYIILPIILSNLTGVPLELCQGI